MKKAFTKSYAKQFIKDLLNSDVKDLSQLKWFYNGAKKPILDKQVLIKLLKENPDFNSKKIIDLFSEYSNTIGKGKFTTKLKLEEFLIRNDDWFNDIFKKIEL